MNATPDGVQRDADKALTEELISLWGLTAESVDRITKLARSDGLSFSDAALRLGLISPADVEDATAWITRQKRTGPVEAAIRHAKAQNTVILRQAGGLYPSNHLLLLHEPDSERSERIRSLRTELMLLVGGGQHRDNIIAVLSPGAREGRSQLCAELALAFAQAGRRTLLVDADMRHPRQHALFCCDNQWGLAQALSLGEAPAMYGMEAVPDLALLPAGVIPPNPLELVSNRRFERMVDAWRRAYDFVLIDTPPVSQYADALAVATAAGRVLIVGRTDSTSFSGMKDLLRRLAPSQARILGSVINKF
jgi:receptor protein-tyrosine kinase